MIDNYRTPDENDCRKNGDADRPPFTVDLLADEIRKRRKLPDFMPRDSEEAARWWIRMQKPANERFETPRQVAVPGQDSRRRWTTPYADRLISSFRVFIRLKRKHQDFILAAFEDGVFYNGDEPAMFYRIYEETQKMRSMGVDEYRLISNLKRKNLIEKMTGHGARS